MLTENEKKANRAHDKLAWLWSRQNDQELADLLEEIYDDMTPMFCDILRRQPDPIIIGDKDPCP